MKKPKFNLLGTRLQCHRASGKLGEKPCPKSFRTKKGVGYWKDEWAVRFNTLEEFEQFVNRHGSVIIQPSKVYKSAADNFGGPVITEPAICIYDDYLG